MRYPWLHDGLTKAGKTKGGLAKALKLRASGVTDLLQDRRLLRADEVPLAAAYLDVDVPPELRAPKEAVDPLVTKGRAKTIIEPVFIKGEVAGGVWAEPTLEFTPVPTDVARDTKWPAEAVYALRVRGNSINRQARDGDLVLCLDVWAAPRKYRNGDWVIVERKRGGLIETTIKRVAHAYNGEWMLEPDSDDKAFQDLIPLEGGEEDTIQVRAFVLDFIRQGTRF